MKLSYNIIWVEDKISERPFKTLIKDISSFLTDNFFKVRIDEAEDFDDFKKIVEKNCDYDLIITDLNLNESHGTEVINFIRDERRIMTEVFFYSANNELKDAALINSNRITFYQLNGTGFHRELEKKIIELITLTIAKFQHIVSMRGMIMHETSSLDLKMASIITNFLNDPANGDKINAILDPMIENMREMTREKNDKAIRGKKKEILKDQVLFNASQKIFALGEILKLLGKEDFSKAYNEEVISLRNQFAHAEMAVNEEGLNFFKVNGANLIFDSELCKTIRRNIIKHERNILEVERLLSKE